MLLIEQPQTNILKYHETVHDDLTIFNVHGNTAGSTLYNHIANGGTLDDIVLMRQLLTAQAYIHKHDLRLPLGAESIQLIEVEPLHVKVHLDPLITGQSPEEKEADYRTTSSAHETWRRVAEGYSQAVVDPPGVSCLTDIYYLGLVLVWALTGESIVGLDPSEDIEGFMDFVLNENWVNDKFPDWLYAHDKFPSRHVGLLSVMLVPLRNRFSAIDCQQVLDSSLQVDDILNTERAKRLGVLALPQQD